MNKSVYRILSAGLLAMAALTGTARAEVEWLDGNGRSCDLVCKKGPGRAVSPGSYKNTGNGFYVCSANYNNEGWRSGYNLAPNWSSVCMVPYGGKEVRATPYLCACE